MGQPRWDAVRQDQVDAGRAIVRTMMRVADSKRGLQEGEVGGSLPRTTPCAPRPAVPSHGRLSTGDSANMQEAQSWMIVERASLVGGEGNSA